MLSRSHDLPHASACPLCLCVITRSISVVIHHFTLWPSPLLASEFYHLLVVNQLAVYLSRCRWSSLSVDGESVAAALLAASISVAMATIPYAHFPTYWCFQYEL